MSGWRSKLLFVMFVYFCGFASGIYALVPGSNDLAEAQGRRKGSAGSFTERVLKSDDFARKFRVKMEEFAGFGRAARSKLGGLLEKKLLERSYRADEEAH